MQMQAEVGSQCDVGLRGVYVGVAVQHTQSACLFASCSHSRFLYRSQCVSALCVWVCVCKFCGKWLNLHEIWTACDCKRGRNSSSPVPCPSGNGLQRKGHADYIKGFRLILLQFRQVMLNYVYQSLSIYLSISLYI